MESFPYQNSSAINFIGIIFRIIAVFVIAVIFILALLKVNDTVTFVDGAVYSNRPQLKITCPGDAKMLKINVHEGQHVNIGDTLFVLENKKNKSEYLSVKSEISGIKTRIAILGELISGCRDRIKSIKKLLAIQANINGIDKDKAKQDIKALNDRIKISNNQSEIVAKKFQADSILYANGAISRLELVEQQSKKLTDSRDAMEIQSTYKIKNYDFENLSNNLKKANQDLEINILELQNEITNHEKQKAEYTEELDIKINNLPYLQEDLNKLTILAKSNGTVSSLFNSKQDIEYLKNGELICIIAPDIESFYAKIILPEKEIAYIKRNQTVNLKIDAFNYYKYGAIKGTISYISNSDVDKSFYCLVQLEKFNKNINLRAGYKLNGDIIIERMRLYEYIIKKILNNLES